MKLQRDGRTKPRASTGSNARTRACAREDDATNQPDPAAPPDPWPAAREPFLVALATGVSVTAAAKAAGQPRRVFTDRRATDADFARDWDEAVEMGTDSIEDRALQRAVVGWEEPVFNHGQQVGTKRVFDSTLTMALLNARQPEKFKRSTRPDATTQAGSGAKPDQDARARVAAKLAALAGHGDKTG